MSPTKRRRGLEKVFPYEEMTDDETKVYKIARDEFDELDRMRFIDQLYERWSHTDYFTFFRFWMEHELTEETNFERKYVDEKWNLFRRGPLVLWPHMDRSMQHRFVSWVSYRSTS